MCLKKNNVWWRYYEKKNKKIENKTDQNTRKRKSRVEKNIEDRYG